MKFPYVKIHGILQPVIPITLHRDKEVSPTEALIDSGANASVFHRDYAVDLGIENLESGERMEFYGIKGTPLIGYAHEVSLEVDGKHFGTSKIAFSDELSPESFNILGQREFFALFSIMFSYSKLEVELMAPVT
jgi:hypothetical protein